MCGKAHLKSVLIGVICLLAANSARAEENKPDCYVLSVGIDKYVQSPLQGCVNDARNMAQQFQSQRGKVFGQVAATVLLEEQGSRAGIGAELGRLKTLGKSGDFIVVFLSGHGGNAKPSQWYFVTQDHTGQEGTKLTDKTLLQFADSMAMQGKKVFVIIDACFSGQLRVNAREQLNKNYPQGGGLILMVSSMPSQTSAAMGRFSAFAQAIFEGLSGHADYNGDGYVTLREVRSYAYHRVHDMQKKGEQDGEIDYSLSISENLKLAKATKSTAGTQIAQLPVKTTPVTNVSQNPAGQLAGTQWTGRENLQGFGHLNFRFMAGGQAVMQDTQGETPGTWSRKGNQITLTFNGGQTTYAGILQNGTLSGTARGGRGQTWSWSVALR